MIEQIEKALFNLRQQKPLILCLTNVVTMDLVANCLLALGAAPIMSVYEEELVELIKICGALYINIGTLDKTYITLVKKAVDLAEKYNKAVILDPVGAGATKIRTQIAKDIAHSSAIIRGNASEIMALGQQSVKILGVESVRNSEEAKDIACRLAHYYQATIVTSGSIDFITDGFCNHKVSYGSQLMELITGMGCALTASIAAFRATLNHSFNASLLAVHYFNLCGEITALKNKHPGAFRSSLLDQLHSADFALMSTIYEK